MRLAIEQQICICSKVNTNANSENICKMCVPFSFVVYTLFCIPVCLFCGHGNVQQWPVKNALCCSRLIRKDSGYAWPVSKTDTRALYTVNMAMFLGRVGTSEINGVGTVMHNETGLSSEL